MYYVCMHVCITVCTCMCVCIYNEFRIFYSISSPIFRERVKHIKATVYSSTVVIYRPGVTDH